VRAAKVVFFFPVAPFIKGLFARADLVPYLYHDHAGEAALSEGHVARSRGFNMKINNNPHMNRDHRNLGLVGTTDGVPFFDDQRRGGWPFILRVGNLPDALSTHMTNVHLHLLSANEFWEVDADAGVLRRRVRAPKTLLPHLHVIVDDLILAYKKGITQRHNSEIISTYILQYLYFDIMPSYFTHSALYCICVTYNVVCMYICRYIYVIL
jgi:hypothetical protein